MLPLPHVVHNIQSDGFTFGWSHHENLGRDLLAAEMENIRWFLATIRNVFGPDVSQCLARTNGCAHGFLTDGSAVVAHVALHHLLLGNHHFWDAERAGYHAVVAGDAAGLEGRKDNPIFAFLNRIRWTDLRAGGFVTMPAYVGGRADALFPLDEIEVDHRLSPVSVAFLARLQA